MPAKRLEYTIDGTNGCWNCTSHALRKPNGYPAIRIKGKRYLAHRYVFEQTFGPIPDGLRVLHACDNTFCINPDHLWLGTQLDNISDRTQKGRTKALKGEQCVFHKLLEVQVLDILRRPESYQSLALEYAVSVDTVRKIKQGKTWKHLQEVNNGNVFSDPYSGASAVTSPQGEQASRSVGET